MGGRVKRCADPQLSKIDARIALLFDLPVGL
jgi:hypothetical protein